MQTNSRQSSDNVGEQIGALNALVVSHTEKGQYRAAINYATRSADLIRQVVGEAHPFVATVISTLAGLHSKLGEYATTLDNLAGVYDLVRNHQLAESLYRHAFEIRRMALGEAHPILAVSLDSLATLSGSFSAAEPLLRKALEIRRKALGDQHPDFATSLEGLAGLYAATGDYVAAEPLSKRALEIRRNTLGEQHPAFASSLNTLALIFAATGRESDAMRLIERSLMTDDRMIGQIFSVSSERRRSAYLRKIRAWVDVFLSLASQLHDSPEAVRSAFSLVLRRKAIEAEVLTAQTRELMEDFYRKLLAGEPRADALRQAKLALKAKHPEPFYWGAFICQGYDGPLAAM